MEALKSQFPELSFYPLQPPASHPFYEYDPFNPSTRILDTGHQKRDGHRKFEVDTIFEKDVEVKMRDKAKLYTDVFRPVTSDGNEKVPAIIAWSPYGKSGGKCYQLYHLSCVTKLIELFQVVNPTRTWGHSGVEYRSIEHRVMRSSKHQIRQIGVHEVMRLSI
jgi:hypothetical protein